MHWGTSVYGDASPQTGAPEYMGMVPVYWGAPAHGDAFPCAGVRARVCQPGLCIPAPALLGGREQAIGSDAMAKQAPTLFRSAAFEHVRAVCCRAQGVTRAGCLMTRRLV